MIESGVGVRGDAPRRQRWRNTRPAASRANANSVTPTTTTSTALQLKPGAAAGNAVATTCSIVRPSMASVGNDAEGRHTDVTRGSARTAINSRRQ